MTPLDPRRPAGGPPMSDADSLSTNDLSAEEVADAIYLSHHMSNTQRSPWHDVQPPAQQEEPPLPENPLPPTESGEPSPASDSSPAPPPFSWRYQDMTLADGAGEVGDWTLSRPGGFGLDGERTIARALRPFKRTAPSPRLPELDEEGTADHAAVWRHWLPILRQAQDRPLEAVLVVDSGSSMVIWRRTATELRVLLERQAAFSTVRVWLLDSDQPRVMLRGETAATARHPAELLDPTGRRLVLVLTDGVGTAWRGGHVQEWLGRWGRCGPVAVVNVLPQSLWHWTQLAVRRTRLRASSCRVANSRLHCVPPMAAAAEVPIPVLDLEEWTLARWAALVAEPGAGAVELPVLAASIRREPSPEYPPDDPVDARFVAPQRVLRFRSAVSPTAFRLATLLAAVPLNIPVMTLVQRAMLPDARGYHLAEVFLSGLLCRVGDDDVSAPTTVAYDFRPGVRQELLAAAFRRDTVRVVRLVADHLAPRVEAVRGFRDALESPDTTAYPDLSDEAARRFAMVEQAVMTALGGDYSRRARALRAALSAPPAHDRKPTTPTDTHSDLPEAGQRLTPVSGSDREPQPSRTRDPRPSQPLWGNVPLRNDNFTGREQLLATLHERLAAAHTAAVLPEALHGTGGVGKTLVAVEYIYRHAAEYDLVWWIPSEDPSAVQSSFVELAQKLQLPLADPSPQVAVPAVLEALRTGDPYARWLLVFDNADQPEDLQQFLPDRPGHVIVTSRNPRWSSVARTVEIDVFSRVESKELLRRRCPELNDDETDQLAEVLGDLPLALEQAGAWCVETGMPVPEYLELFEQQREDLLRKNTPTDYPVTVAAAWNVSLKRLTPEALQLVQLCSCFAPEPIQRAVFTELRVSTGPAELAEALSRPLLLGRAFREINRYSLAWVDHRNDTIQLHRIVQAVVQDQMSPTELARMRHVAHQLLLNADPMLPGIPKHWPLYISLRPHVRVSQAIDCRDTAVRRLVINQAVFLNAWGEYQSSYDLAEEARQRWHDEFGEDDPDTLSAARRVGVALRSMGEYARARTLDERTFALLRQTLGDDHEETQLLAGLFSSDLRAVGDFAGAKRLNEDTFTRARRVFGDDDLTTLYAAHNLAMSLRLTGDFSAARTLDEQTWRGRRRLFGDDDRFTLLSLDSLALDEREAGDYVAAHARQENTVKAHRRLLGDTHPQTLLAIKNLAVARRRAGDLSGALVLATEALAGFRKRFGEDQPDSTAAAMNLSVAHRQTGDLVQARELGRSSWERYRDRLGARHPYTAVGATNLAVTLRLSGEVREARRLNENALADLTATLGADHPFTLVCAANLASDLAAGGNDHAALELDTDTLRRSRRVLGDRHPTTLALSLNQALDLAQVNRCAEAGELSLVLARFREILGPLHPTTLSAENRTRADCDIEPMPFIS